MRGSFVTQPWERASNAEPLVQRAARRGLGEASGSPARFGAPFPTCGHGPVPRTHQARPGLGRGSLGVWCWCGWRTRAGGHVYGPIVASPAPREQPSHVAAPTNEPHPSCSVSWACGDSTSPGRCSPPAAVRTGPPPSVAICTKPASVATVIRDGHGAVRAAAGFSSRRGAAWLGPVGGVGSIPACGGDRFPT